MRWLARKHPEMVRRNLEQIPIMGRWDDLYIFVDTPLEKDAFNLMKHQLALDIECKTPSLLAKWLKSENTSSLESRELAEKTRRFFGMTARQYRKTLSILRERIKVLERLMSLGRFDEIKFDKIPSRAGVIYRNAFARHDLTRERYEKFAKSEDTKVNAKTLNPCDIIHAARDEFDSPLEASTRLMVEKYWKDLENYFHDAVFDGVAVVDTSSSMRGYDSQIAPIDVAISLGMYCAEKCSPASPWYGHYITFSHTARLVKIQGADFVDKVERIYAANLCQDTNIESVFDLLLRKAIEHGLSNDEMPRNVIIISDQEFNSATGDWQIDRDGSLAIDKANSTMEKIMKKWEARGYSAPHLVFWCVESRSRDNIPMRDNGNVTFVSGYSPVLFDSILTGKTGWDLVKDKLDSERYSAIN